MGKEEGIKIEEGRGGNIDTPKRESRPETIFLDFWSIPIVFSLPCHAKSKVAFPGKEYRTTLTWSLPSCVSLDSTCQMSHLK
jgi:hypothetical protein